MRRKVSCVLIRMNNSMRWDEMRWDEGLWGWRCMVLLPLPLCLSIIPNSILLNSLFSVFLNVRWLHLLLSSFPFSLSSFISLLLSSSFPYQLPPSYPLTLLPSLNPSTHPFHFLPIIFSSLSLPLLSTLFPYPQSTLSSLLFSTSTITHRRHHVDFFHSQDDIRKELDHLRS